MSSLAGRNFIGGEIKVDIRLLSDFQKGYFLL